MRLDKYVSTALGVSRNDARQILKKKKIKVDGLIVDKFDYNVDQYQINIEYQNNKISYQQFIYIMLNKPKGYVCATIDNLYPTVIDIISDNFPNKNLSIAGRLDVDTEGLVLITNDGPMLHKITSPKSNTKKKYYVEVEGTFDKDDIEIIKNGVTLYDGVDKSYLTKPAELEIIDNNRAYISISEGRYHQVKKMCLSLGKKVTFLKRISIGNLTLDNNLSVGQFRLLTNEEIAILKEYYL